MAEASADYDYLQDVLSLQRPSSCFSSGAGMVHSSERRAFLVTNLLGMKTWLSTDQGHRRGIRHLQRHMAEFLDYGLPATEVDVRGYVAYAVELRPFRLDSSSVSTYLAGVSKWHAKVAWLVRQAGIVDSSDQPVKVHNPCRHYLVVELLVVLDKRNKQVSQAKSAWTLAEWKCICMSGFDITTRSGLHHGLVFVFCTFGCLRKGATEFGRVLFDLIYGERGVSIQWKSPPDPYESLVLVVYNDEELSPLGGQERRCQGTPTFLPAGGGGTPQGTALARLGGPVPAVTAAHRR
ncbi:hypothetical protein CYMTET_55361 [Cymbomonas tetramitiformis]|uniref:Uncharacterized protein n=1 Tax=Cymbomonas tetramitiformis TaxID=36881 RepID=A0AAE0BEB5_9CHLO|nr:hypothetical protein CYMTET_55361 [Cymbomonas tetramitiformis]